MCEADVFSKRWPDFRSTAERRHKQGAPLLFDNGGAPAGSAVIPLHFRRGQMNLTDGCVTQTLD